MDFDPDQFLDYYEFAAELKKIDAVASASEAHGILIGQLCGGLKLEGLMWLKQFLMGVGVKREPREDQRNWFYQFHDFCSKELISADLAFKLLLPDDEDPLEDRLEAVGDWCSGFLAGFASSGHAENSQFPEDIQAALKDMVEITKVDVEVEDEVGFAEENAYFQLTEYLKTVALLIYTEYGLARQPLHTMPQEEGLQDGGLSGTLSDGEGSHTLH